MYVVFYTDDLYLLTVCVCDDPLPYLAVVAILYPFFLQDDEQVLTLQDYVGIIQDALVLGKNICIMRQ